MLFYNWFIIMIRIYIYFVIGCARPNGRTLNILAKFFVEYSYSINYKWPNSPILQSMIQIFSLPFLTLLLNVPPLCCICSSSTRKKIKGTTNEKSKGDPERCHKGCDKGWWYGGGNRVVLEARAFVHIRDANTCLSYMYHVYNKAIRFINPIKLLIRLVCYWWTTKTRSHIWWRECVIFNLIQMPHIKDEKVCLVSI